VSAKPKAGAKVGAQAMRKAIYETFGDIPVDSENLNFLYSRRHLATVPDGKWRELRYVVELDELEQAIWKTLDRIRERDGARIFKEAASYLHESIDVGEKAESVRRKARSRTCPLEPLTSARVERSNSAISRGDRR
jgi:hypothetical protein